MPILPKENFSNWYIFNIDSKPYILQSYNETLEHQVQDVKYVQADIGNHIVSINPKKYNLSVSSPLLVFDYDNSADTLYDIYNLVLSKLSQIQLPITVDNSPDYILKSAIIQLGQESSISAVLEGWQSFSSNLSYVTEEYDFYARQAKFYDIVIQVFGENYLITSGTLNISVNTSTNYYVTGSNQFTGNVVPLYGIHGYTVTGDVTFLVTLIK